MHTIRWIVHKRNQNELSCHHILMLGTVRGTCHLNFASASGTVVCCVLLQRAVWRCRVRTSTSAPWHLAGCLASWLFCTTASGQPPSRVSVALVTVTISAVHQYVVCDVQWCVNDVCSVCRSCHGLQAMGHRATMFPDYHDALWPNPTGRIHRLSQEVSSLGCHPWGAHPGSSSWSTEAIFNSACVLSHPHVLRVDRVCFKFRIMQPEVLPLK